MPVVLGILLLLIGVAFPLALLFWLNGRLSRKPPLRPAQVGLLLAFNGVLPVGLILLGLGRLSPRLWASSVLRTASLAALIAAAVVLVVLVVLARRNGGNNGR